jgi:hypothetical protein
MLSVLLAGVAAYRHMPQLPAVLNNLVDLQTVFGGATVVADPETPAQLLDPLAHLAASRAETLVCYFAGHGVRGLDGELCLALPGTIDKKAEAQRTALPVERLMAVLNGARAGNRIVILDCCFSGLAMRVPSAFDLHLLTATGRTEKALAPEGARNTLFTGGLLDVWRAGLPEGGEWITVGDLYRWPCGGADDPTPHQRVVDRSGGTRLVRNAAFQTAATAAGRKRRAELATRVGWRDPARAARLFGGIVADAGRDPGPDPELTAYRMSEAAWLGASGDVPAAVARWTALRAASDADPAEVERNLTYWRSGGSEVSDVPGGRLGAAPSN